jgi:Ser/Thr protein kinase RdoA (MazF antagonist)
MTTLVERAVAAWGLQGTDVSLLHLSENATFLVSPADGRRAVLRVHRLGYHDEAEIASELAWMDALSRETDVCVPAAIPALDGRRVVPIGDSAGGAARFAVLFEHVEGSHPDSADPDGFEALGALTARLHRHARQWRRPEWFRRFAWDVPAAVGPAARWGRWEDAPGVGPAEQQLLGRAAERVRSRLVGFGDGAQRFGLIHADLRLDNLIGGPDGAFTVLDFDDCGFGWYLYDLAAALSFFEDDPAVPELIERWLAGYRSVAPVGAKEQREVWTFVVLRRLMLLAWIGTHPGAETARQLGAGFAAGASELAEGYLGDRIA